MPSNFFLLNNIIQLIFLRDNYPIIFNLQIRVKLTTFKLQNQTSYPLLCTSKLEFMN